MKRLKVIVTGGAGYIGSTICSALEDSAMTPIIIDDLSSGPADFVRDRIFYRGDFADRLLLERVLSEHSEVVGVIHCAAKIKVIESVAMPFEYYECNVSKSIEFLKNLVDLNLTNLVFSSTAALYAPTANCEVNERSAVDPQSPYAKSKYMIELVINDYSSAYGLNSIVLRYFNVIGADPAFRTGPYDLNPSHILGKLTGALNGHDKGFVITGTSWPTRDGSGIRDYVHVWDLAQAHVAALRRLMGLEKAAGYREVINLGTGLGVTVKEFVAAFQEVTGESLKVSATGPREGDIPGAYTTSLKAKDVLNWQPKLSMREAIRHSIEWGKIRNSAHGQ